MNIAGISMSHDPYRIRSVMDWLPDDGEEVLAYGHLTYCCECDMAKEKKWYKCRFSFSISSYKLKKRVVALEESQMEDVQVMECWDLGLHHSYGAGEHLIGVTKWKKLKPDMSKEELGRVLEMVTNDMKMVT